VSTPEDGGASAEIGQSESTNSPSTYAFGGGSKRPVNLPPLFENVLFPALIELLKKGECEEKCSDKESIEQSPPNRRRFADRRASSLISMSAAHRFVFSNR
jgi:hypothetical protein